MKSLPDNKSVSIKEAAQILGISTKTLRRWEARGVINPDRTAGGHRRYDLNLIDELRSSKKKRKPKVRISHIQAPLPTIPPETIAPPTAPDTTYRQPITQEIPQLFSSLHIAQKSALKYIAYTFTSLLLLFSFTKLDKIMASPLVSTIKERIALTPPPLVSPIAEDVAVTEEIATKIIPTVLGISLDKQTFKVYVESTFGENVIIEKNLTVEEDATITGDLAVNGGNLTTTSTTVNFVNDNATTLNIGGAATTVSIAATTGTTTINNNLVVTGTDNDIAGTLNLSGNTLTSSGDLTIDPTGGGVSIGTGTPGNLDLAGDDLYVTGDFEVDGVSYIPTLSINGESFTDLTGTGLSNSSGTLTVDLGDSIESSEITDGTISEPDLSVTNTPTDNYILSYDQATSGFTWVVYSSGLWTDSGPITYLTETSDDLAVGGTDSSATFFIDVSTGDLTIDGTLAVNGDSITADGALTIDSTSYVRIGDSGTPGSANADDDLYVEGDLEIDAALILGTDSLTDITGDGIEISANALQIDLDTTATDGSTTSSVSGMEFANNELSLIRGCGAGQVLKWDDSNYDWECADDDSGGSGTGYWQENSKVIAPINVTWDVAVGGISTATATFIVNADTGNVVTDGTLAVNGDSITADGATLIINAGGNVDIQDALNADSITSDAG